VMILLPRSPDPVGSVLPDRLHSDSSAPLPTTSQEIKKESLL
jgi:hypothetical protein